MKTNDAKGLEFTLSEDGKSYKVSKYNYMRKDIDVVIPSVYNDKPVISIDSYAFKYCRSLKSITIPNSVTSIGEGAFYNCRSLTSITIPNSVTSIGEWAFKDCDSLECIVVEENNTVYDSRNNCNAIIETSTNTLIVGCKNTIIPDSVTSIGSRAFYNCSSLTSITIPNSVTSIGDDAFYGCSSLTSITIPNSVTSIEDSAFKYCHSLTSVTIGNSVTSIGEWAFDGCSSLTSIAIPDSVTSIGNYSFYNCSSLTSITIPNSVTSIGELAFYNCRSLTSITIPNSVTSIGELAFHSCRSLIGIVVDTNNVIYDSRNNCNAIIETATNTLLVGCQNTIIPDSVTSIGSRAFYNCSSLTSITIPNSVTTIGEEAFKDCDSLENVIISYGVTSIGEGAFRKCYSLKFVYIFEGVTSIGDCAFYGCNSLKMVNIPYSVTSIGELAFFECPRESLHFFSVEEKNYVSIENSKFESESFDLFLGEWGTPGLFYDTGDKIKIGGYRGQDKNVIIPKYTADGQKIEGISDGAFILKKIESIIIPDSITSIGSKAFAGCRSLKTVYYKGTKEQWNNISIGVDGNECLTNATIIYNYKG